MANYGLEVRDNTNRIIFSTQHTTVSLIAVIDVPANGYFSKTFSYLIALTFKRIFYTVQLVNIPPDIGMGLVPNISLDFSGINVGPASGSSVRCQILVYAQ